MSELVSRQATATKKPLLSQWIRRAAVAVGLATLCATAYVHYRMIVSPGPLEYREGAIVVATEFLRRGGDPYALANQPVYTNVYGIVYNLTVLPFAQLFGNGFTVHRALSATYLLSGVGLVAWMLRRNGASLGMAVVAASFLYAQLAVCTVAPGGATVPCTSLGRPDALGWLLFLLSILLPWRFRFAHWAMAVALVLSVLAFFTKPYFLIGLPMVAAYVFLFRSKTGGLLWGVAFLVVFAVAFATVMTQCETYYNVAIKANLHSVQLSVPHMLSQLGQYSKSTPGLTILFALAAIAGVRALVRLLRIHGVDSRRIGTLRPVSGPLIIAPVDFLWFVTGCMLFLLVWRLGQHVGNSMLYFYQLFTPFMLLVIFRFLRHSKPQRSWILASLLVLDGVLLLTRNIPAPPQPHQAAWDEWRMFLADKKNPYVPPPLAWTAMQLGKPVYDNGMSEYYAYFGMMHPSTDFQRQMITEYDRFREEMKRKLRREEFDVIVLPLGSDSQMFATVRWHLVFEHYRPVRKVPMPMDWSPNYSGWILEPIGRPEADDGWPGAARPATLPP